MKVKVLQQQVEIQQLQSQIYQCQQQQVGTQINDAATALAKEVDKIKKAHGYGADVKFNFVTGELEKSPK